VREAQPAIGLDGMTTIVNGVLRQIVSVRLTLHPFGDCVIGCENCLISKEDLDSRAATVVSGNKV